MEEWITRNVVKKNPNHDPEHKPNLKNKSGFRGSGSSMFPNPFSASENSVTVIVINVARNLISSESNRIK